MSTNLDSDEVARLFSATNTTLRRWTDLRVREVGDGFPTKVTAFHPDMAVHGKYGEPCRECGSPVQRIVHVGRETNYCAGCQTGGRILADRAISRLLKDDRPKHLDDTV
jgi:formamidopyrimidine-DNA glycosylase